jgi:hypothetical protein
MRVALSHKAIPKLHKFGFHAGYGVMLRTRAFAKQRINFIWPVNMHTSAFA